MPGGFITTIFGLIGACMFTPGFTMTNFCGWLWLLAAACCGCSVVGVVEPPIDTCRCGAITVLGALLQKWLTEKCLFLSVRKLVFTLSKKFNLHKTWRHLRAYRCYLWRASNRIGSRCCGWTLWNAGATGRFWRWRWLISGLRNGLLQCYTKKSKIASVINKNRNTKFSCQQSIGRRMQLYSEKSIEFLFYWTVQ